MATVAVLADVLESFETDLPDRVLQRHLDTAEEDVRQYLTSDERKRLPITIWEGTFPLILGAEDVLTVDSSLRGYPVVRFEGTVEIDSVKTAFTADTRVLETDEAGTGTVRPEIRDEGPVSGALFVVTVDEDGTELTIDAGSTTVPTFITRVLGLQQVSPPSQVLSAVLDLVQLATIYRGVVSERTGQHSQTNGDYHSERQKVLARLVFSSGGSLIR